MPKRLTLPGWNEEALRQLGNTGKRVERKIIALRMVAQGQTAQKAADAIAVGEATVRRWVAAFNDQGIASLPYARHPGATPKLSPKQQEELARRIEEGPPPELPITVWRGVSLQRWIAERFGAQYSLRGVYELLHRLGFSSLMPRPRHPDSDDKAQEAFKKKRYPKPTGRYENDTGRTSALRSGSRTKRASAKKGR